MKPEPTIHDYVVDRTARGEGEGRPFVGLTVYDKVLRVTGPFVSDEAAADYERALKAAQAATPVG